jgi:protease-4
MSSPRFVGIATLAVVFLGASALFALAEEKPSVVRLAQIKLGGSPSETPVSADPLFGTRENFQSKLDRIRKAKKDKGIDGLYLELDGLGVGYGKIDELRAAIADFRKAGKKVYAYMESAGTKDYLVACACDRIGLPESGTLMLLGVRAEVTFYKGLLDKLGIKADMLQMGDYKGAAEPMTRTSMSKQYRERLESVLKDYYEESIVRTIAGSRSGKKFRPDQVKKLIDEGPYTAKRALAAGLIDEIAYPNQFKVSLKTNLKANQLKLVLNYGQKKAQELDFGNPFAIFKLLGSSSSGSSSSKPKIAVIYATGTIVTGRGGVSLFGGQSIGSTTMVEAIRKVEEDSTVKAIVLRVDSPGGSALASDLIWNELNRSKKPVIASMSDVAASGGYYISMAANKIYAEPGTLTGSIGVVGGKMALGGLEEKVGLKTEVISFGANSGILSSTFPFKESEKKAMKNMMADVYDQFLTKAIQGRAKAGKKFSRADFTKFAEGRIWTGRQAKANGLVDELGTLEDAIAAAKTLAELPKDSEPELMVLPRGKGLLDALLQGKISSPFQGKAELTLLRKLPELSGHLHAVEGLLQLRGEPVWLIMPHRVAIR